jgi:putative transposase
VDKAGNTANFLLRAHRDEAAARRYFENAIDLNGVPETVTMDKSGANLATPQAINAERETPINIRQVKYLNNIVEHDHQDMKRRANPMIGFKDFRRARIILSGIETMHMIRKEQMKADCIARTDADRSYSPRLVRDQCEVAPKGERSPKENVGWESAATSRFRPAAGRYSPLGTMSNGVAY